MVARQSGTDVLAGGHDPGIVDDLAEHALCQVSALLIETSPGSCSRCHAPSALSAMTSANSPAVVYESRAVTASPASWTTARMWSASDEPPRLPPDDERLEQLSEAERRVGALAAQGRTNREIASKLCITVSTVEQHLTRVYRKLSVKRRKDLPAGLQTPVVGSHTLATCDTLLTTTPASREASLLRRQPDVRTTHVRPPVPSLSEVGRRIPS